MTRIVGGAPVEESSRYPWFTRVVAGSGTGGGRVGACGGALIAKDIVLTAAHCGDPTKVYPGRHNRDLPNRENINVESFLRHPEYGTTDYSVDFDIMMVHLTNFSAIADPVRLNFDDDYPVEEGESLTMLGFGSVIGGPATGEPDPPTEGARILQTAETMYVPFETCAVASDPDSGDRYGVSETRTAVKPLWFCTTGPEIDSDLVTSTCFGDSGGPILKEDFFEGAVGEAATNDLLLAVISGASGYCGNRYLPLWNQRVSWHKQWIVETGCSMSKDPPPEWNCGLPGVDSMGMAPENNGIYFSATATPTNSPVVPPTDAPVVPPTDAPTETPVVAPTDAPVIPPTDAPIVAPTVAPVVPATEAPVNPPTEAPTVKATVAATDAPTVKATVAATDAPTAKETVAATDAPTVKATVAATNAPTVKETVAPTGTPTVKETVAPTGTPTVEATVAVTESPTIKASDAPTDPRTEYIGVSPAPTATATDPTGYPTTLSPTPAPTQRPTTERPNPFPNPILDGTGEPTDYESESKSKSESEDDEEVGFVCPICGDEDEIITNPDTAVILPILGIKTCQELFEDAAEGKIGEGSECNAILLLTSTVCSCAIETESPSATPSASPSATPSSSPSTVPSVAPTDSPSSSPSASPTQTPETCEAIRIANEAADPTMMVNVTIDFTFKDTESAETVGWFLSDPHYECFRVGSRPGAYSSLDVTEHLSLVGGIEYLFIVEVDAGIAHGSYNMTSKNVTLAHNLIEGNLYNEEGTFFKTSRN